MDDNSGSDADGVRIIRRMGSSDAQERADAERELQQSGLNTTESLFALLNTERKRWHTMHRRLKVSKYALFIALCLLYGRWCGHPPSVGWTLMILLLLDICFTTLYLNKRRAFQQGMSLALSRFEDLTLVGPLLVLYSGISESKQLIEPTLIRLLPRFQATDAALLKTWQRERLYRELDMCSSRLIGNSVNVELMIAILKALEQIGDEKALKHVEPLVIKAKNPRVREAAQACLPFLQERVHQQRLGNILLRPSDTAIVSEELVRPVAYNNDNEPAQLLRANHSGGEANNEQR